MSLGTSWIVAQDQEIAPKPTPPYLAELPAESSWKLTYTPMAPDSQSNPPDQSQTSSPKPPASIVSTLVELDRGLRRETTSWSNNDVKEKWIVGSNIFTQPNPGGHFEVSSAVWAEIVKPGEKYPDFPDLVWVNPTNLQGVESKNGERCYVYFWSKTGRDEFTPSDSPLPIEPTKVWVSVVTKLPVAVENKHASIDYTYHLPVAPLTLPKECQDVINAAEALKTRLEGQQMQRPQ